MIPLRLHLSNFLSYGSMPEPLDLSDVHLACLSGPNGHGKSALLDAITWALWGKARGCEGGQDQERLIRDGADSMSVEFVFSLEDQTYRVVRSRSKMGKGDVGFNVQAADGSWTDLAGEGKQDTQRRIIERLRMEYETFVTSAFILQGRADTFTRLDPRERKDVLGKILGLEIYERLAERAREAKKIAQADADAHARTLERLEHDLETRDDLERRKIEAAQTLAGAETQRSTAASAAAALRERVTDLRVVEAAAKETTKRKDEAERALTRETAEIERLNRRAEELESTAKIDDDIRAAAASVPKLERDEARLEEARSRHDELTAEAASLEGRLGEERSRLDAERVSHERNAARLEQELGAETAARDLLERAKAEMNELDGASAKREGLLARRAEIRERRAALEAERLARETEGVETEEKLSLLDATGAGCPLCGQELTPAHRKQVKASLNARLRELSTGERAAAKEAKQLTAELSRVDSEGAALKEALERRETIANQAAALGQQLERLTAARGELDGARLAAKEIADRLKAEDFAVPEREKLARVREEFERVGFDAAAYRDLKKILEGARRAERAIAGAREAEAALEACRGEAQATIERHRGHADLKSAAEADLVSIGERLVSLPALLEEIGAAEEAGASAQKAVDEAGRALATTTHALEVLDREAIAAAEARTARTASKRLAGLYDKLTKAFGRDGIPARIIGNAIPELRIEANRLLALLTDGQLAVSIDPVKETKSRGLKETLEVTVFDAAGGKRAYEMYSGGERLRIDFALRVALSRLLATRAGARLETLVVDEGFGSQDSEGRMRLLEAVMRIRSEFRTVLVITHIDELKEHFPVRIEVRKDPLAGSRVSVV
jgi:DNA repair protein SbcC/Rad50